MRVCVRAHTCICVCAFARLPRHTLAHTHMSVFMHASNTLHSLAYVHTVCVCVCLFMGACVFVCLCARAYVHVRAYGVISLCLGRGIFMLISVPSGQMQLSCLLKRDNIPNAKLETSVSICTSAHRISISSVAPHHKATLSASADRPLCVCACMCVLTYCCFSIKTETSICTDVHSLQFKNCLKWNRTENVT